MLSDNKIQNAGDNATQVQAGIVNVGIDEKRVREIIREEKQLYLQEASIVAGEVASKRLDNYTDILVPKLVRAELLESFTDPAIQVLFRQSEKTAICSEREKDYEMLSELLIHRIKRGDNYTTKAAIQKAIDEVNYISDEALLGLTLIFVITSTYSCAGNVELGLFFRNELFKKIIKDGDILLDNNDWTDNLEIVNAIRKDSVMQRKRLEDYFAESMTGYCCLGIKKESENHEKAKKILTDNFLPPEMLTDNILNNDYVRLEVCRLDNFDDVQLLAYEENKKPYFITLNNLQKEALFKIVALYENDSNIKIKFLEILKSYDYIRIVMEWWNTYLTKEYFAITPIGKVIAHTYAKSVDETFPDLD